MSFSAEKEYFSEFLKARGSNDLIDMIDLGILPKIYKDYAQIISDVMGVETIIKKLQGIIRRVLFYLQHRKVE